MTNTLVTSGAGFIGSHVAEELDNRGHQVVALGGEPDLIHLPARNEVIHACSSHEKVQRLLGGRKLYSLEDGLVCMAGWVRHHGARSSQEFKNIEVKKNFPKAWLMESGR
jgi:NAD(P)-dependent dehydrogenase (short-subunit alcohol dehydrogenase family)